MKQKIERLRSLMEKATGLPWQSQHDFSLDGEFTIIGNVDGEIIDGHTHHTYTMVAEVYDNDNLVEDRGNAALIVEAINALPDLLSHIDALEARVAEQAENINLKADFIERTLNQSTPADDRVEAAERALAEAVEVLNGIKWRSDDKDNMEFAARITYSQMDRIRAFLTKRGEKSNA